MSRHLGSLVLAVALMLTATACSDDTPEEPGPANPSSGSPTGDGPSATTETSAPPTTEPTTPTVTPASGPELRQDHLSVHAPRGWSVTREGDDITGFAVDDVLLSTLFIGEVPDLSGEAPISLDQQARSSIRSGTYLRDPEILEPVEIDGLLWFHTSGPIDAASYEDSFGTITSGVLLDITITTGIGIVSPAERRKLIDGILASADVL